MIALHIHLSRFLILISFKHYVVHAKMHDVGLYGLKPTVVLVSIFGMLFIRCLSFDKILPVVCDQIYYQVLHTFTLVN
uniref:Uncharacterized protein n=1 Tax=Arundo donax TaxID=35708 RepID=A0A0A8Z3B4_ARUDO